MEQRLLEEKRHRVEEQLKVSKRRRNECVFILLTLLIEDLGSLIFTSYVLLNKEGNRSAQFANLLITASVVVYQLISTCLLWRDRCDLERKAAVHDTYLRAASALRNEDIREFFNILNTDSSSEIRKALHTFEDDEQTLLSVAIDKENFGVATYRLPIYMGRSSR